MNIANMAQATGKPAIEECDAGMLKLAVPIFVNEAFIGTVSGCGLLLDDGEIDTYLVSKVTEMEEAPLKELAVGIPAMSMEKARSISRYIQERVDQIVAAFPGETP